MNVCYFFFCIFLGTPSNYEPPAFQHCERTFYFESKPINYDVGKISTEFTATAFNLKSYYIQNVNELDDIVLMSGTEDLHIDSVNNENLLNTTVDSHIGNDFNSVNGGVNNFYFLYKTSCIFRAMLSKIWRKCVQLRDVVEV